VCRSENDLLKQNDIIVQLLDKDVGGIAMVPAPSAPTPAYQVRQIRERGVPLVFCHRGVEGMQAPLLAIPFKDVGRMAGETLARYGHRRVAFISFRASDATRAYETGLREAITAAGGELPEEFVNYIGISHADASQNEEAVLPVLEKMCSGANRPTAIMTGFDTESELVYLLLGQLGLKVPEDISLIGFGGTWRDGAMLRRLSAITVDETELGRKASRLLHRMRIGELPLDDHQKIDMPLGLSEGRTLAGPQE
ncbi:MAG: substrate-binding domain-containing protein, partial [Pirellulales bacterium]|nr:substrate-binding domain-containing protein [Pirellulales bacterium]